MTRGVRVLAFHAPYQCEHRGVCCTSGWPIPVEPDRRAALEPLLRAEIARSRTTAPGLDDAGRMVLPMVSGACLLYDRDGQRCRAHAELGHDALPLSCRQFPRVTVSDPRGASVTLSHVCPTARRLLGDGRPIAILTNPPHFPADGEYVGLDAREALPPLLRRDMLMEWESWWDWEARSVAAIAAHEDDPTRALGILAHATRAVRPWTPADGALSASIAAAFQQAERAAEPWDPDGDSRKRWIREAYARIPDGLRDRAPIAPIRGDAGAKSAPLLARYLAAHAFGNWAIHLGRDGLSDWFHSLEVAFVLAQALGVGDADLVLRHLTR